MLTTDSFSCCILFRRADSSLFIVRPVGLNFVLSGWSSIIFERKVEFRDVATIGCSLWECAACGAPSRFCTFDVRLRSRSLELCNVSDFSEDLALSDGLRRAVSSAPIKLFFRITIGLRGLLTEGQLDRGVFSSDFLIFRRLILSREVL